MRLVSRENVELVRAALPANQHTLRERTGLSKTTVSRALHELRENLKEVRISGWERAAHGGPSMAIYARVGEDGSLETALRPGQAEKLKQLKNQADLRRERETREAERRNPPAPKPDPLMSAFFGKSVS